MIELWLVDVQRSAAALAALELETPRLTSQDHRRARALKAAGERAHRLAVYAALRLLIERHAGPAVASQPFLADAAGKPRLAGTTVTFSLSHVEGYALIALTDTGEIGVDLEYERPLKMSARRRDELIAAAEGLAGKRLASPSPDARVLQAWSRLEAFAKATGRGIGRTLADLGLRSGQTRTLAEVIDAGKAAARAADLSVRDIPLEQGLYAAVALAKADRLHPRWLPTDRAGLGRLLSARSRSRPHPG